MELRRDVFQAIADPTRRKILIVVAVQAMTAGAIAENFESSRQTISKHLQILNECELLNQTSTGREIYYHLNPEKMKDVVDFIEQFRQLWEDRFSRMDSVLEKLSSQSNNK